MVISYQRLPVPKESPRGNRSTQPAALPLPSSSPGASLGQRARPKAACCLRLSSRGRLIEFRLAGVWITLECQSRILISRLLAANLAILGIAFIVIRALSPKTYTRDFWTSNSLGP